MSGRDTGIASRLRAAGLRVIEVDGWQTRGSTDFDPDGSVNHHTAGPSSGATPSLNTCINGRPDLAGPLCNVFQSREPGGDDIAYVVAAGRANHAGEGGWKGLSGNRKVYGLEVEHTGTSASPDGRLDISARIHAAMFEGSPDYVCQHKEWAGARKVDYATNPTGDGFRDRVEAARSPYVPSPPPDDGSDADMPICVKGNASGKIYATNWIHKNHIPDPSQMSQMILTGLRVNQYGQPFVVEQRTIDGIPDAPT